MTHQIDPGRRSFLKGIGCSVAAYPLATNVTFAAAPGENRLVVIVMRGALDGLSAVAPYGDPAYRGLRPELAVSPDDGGVDLDGRFALHPELAPLAPLWRAGELAFAHAVSTPYRDKRSHFDGQDLLENGGGDPSGSMTRSGDGWLNRALGHIPGSAARNAVAVGRERMILLDGPNDALSWAPDSNLTYSDHAHDLFAYIYERDPLFAAAHREAQGLDASVDGMEGARRKGASAEALAKFTARMLNEESRIAAFSLGGFDTHRRQFNSIVRPLRRLSGAIVALRDGLGRNWETTTVVCITEFGRTARQNGTKGTDHGTGGVMIFAGGALSGARVHGDWPGVGEGQLYRDRDLMATNDLRRFVGWTLRDLYGIEAAAIEREVFPGVDLGANPRLIA